MRSKLLDTQQASNHLLFGLALIFSLLMHFAIMRALPWLEAVKTKPPITILAELQEAPPPPPPSQVAKPEVVKPEVVKDIQPKPTPKTQAVAVPVLAAERTEQVANQYTVPDIPKPATVPTQPSPVAAPETQTKETAAPAASSVPSNAVSSSASTSTWVDSDVWDDFGSNLQRLCERYKQYPAIAIRRGYQGSGKVLVRFSAEGKTTSVTIEKSTGQKSLDDQALEMVRKSLNELPVPAKFKGREFKLTIPVDFKLE
ncbi:energy transducer TonB [Methylotenera sp.]|uniref:energy transducer TonB n=1 Tax=Methylotenera sp. TaxID=2051956 RepID=UPI00248782C8|nr:energy transducer TonB [Methylotenera sp.]MDI1298725.1 energy transducer TonB [Methylotenera sp.]